MYGAFWVHNVINSSLKVEIWNLEIRTCYFFPFFFSLLSVRNFRYSVVII